MGDEVLEETEFEPFIEEVGAKFVWERGRMSSVHTAGETASGCVTERQNGSCESDYVWKAAHGQ